MQSVSKSIIYIKCAMTHLKDGITLLATEIMEHREKCEVSTNE